MPVVHLGIGSNLGDRQSNCIGAVRRLEECGLRILSQSSLVESEPWGVKDQPRFMNMAVEAETDLPPSELLELLKRVEKDMGREETFRWGPRVIDIDILFYDDDIIDIETLRVPHPFLHERGFVLAPLAEIAPDKVHPVLKKTVSEIFASSAF